MSAFSYFGSKRRIAAKLCDRLPPHSAWVEIFCGSAAMTLAKKPAPIEVINDIHGEIVNLFRQLQTNGEELERLIYFTPYARAEFELARRLETGLTDIERARRFLVAAMMSINGTFGKAAGGFSFSNSYSRNGMEARVSRWYQMPDRLRKVAERLRNVRIEQKDGLTLFKEFRDRPGTLVYLDPPYFAKRTNGYDCDANSREFHEKLLESVSRAKCMVFISGYQNELYDSVLTARGGWSKEIIRATTKGNNGKSFERAEVLWFNKAFVTGQQRQRIPLKLTAAESKNNKINPSRP
jgi:DNA adenine methylase